SPDTAPFRSKAGADGVSGVPDAADDLAAADTVTDLERDAAGLQVRVEGEAIGSEGEAHLIAGDGLPRDRDRGTDLSRGLGNILGDPVPHERDRAVRDRQHVRAVP